jgi:hypothetical protein
VVRGKYQLINRSSKPVLVKSYGTGCSCSASEPAAGQAPPFTLMPGRSAEFVISTVLLATHEPVRTFQAVVDSECEGKALPGLLATMKVRIEDALLPYPPQVNAVSIPAGRPSPFQVLLATRQKETAVGRPSAIPSDPGWIHATLVEQDSSDLDRSGLKTRYRLDVTLTPQYGSAVRSGRVTLQFGERTPIQIPVECSIKVPYRLSSDVITLRGRPGEKAETKLFYEFFDPALSAPRVSSAPEGVSSKIEDFDPTTKQVSVWSRIPKLSPGSRPAGDLAIQAGNNTPAIRIPIVYEVANP